MKIKDKKHKDVEFIVKPRGLASEFTSDTFDGAATSAILLAHAHGECYIDMIVHSRAGALWVGGEDGAEQYDDDPDASVLNRLHVKIDDQGRIP